MKEATARIKINKLLKAAGWRFFADAGGPANVQLERGNPYVLTTFPPPGSVTGYQKGVPDPKRLIKVAVRRQPRTDHPLRAKDPSRPRPHLGREER